MSDDASVRLSNPLQNDDSGPNAGPNFTILLLVKKMTPSSDANVISDSQKLFKSILDLQDNESILSGLSVIWNGYMSFRPMQFQPMQFQPLSIQPITLSTACNFNRMQFQPLAISTACNFNLI